MIIIAVDFFQNKKLLDFSNCKNAFMIINKQ